MNLKKWFLMVLMSFMLSACDGAVGYLQAWYFLNGDTEDNDNHSHSDEDDEDDEDDDDNDFDDADAPFTAWVSLTGAEVTLSSTLSQSYHFYRSRDDNCDISQYTSCTQGQLDTVDASSNVINDTAFTLENSAHYILENTEQDTFATTYLTGDRFSIRQGHAMTILNDQIFLIGGSGNDNSLFNDVWKSDDGINWQLLTSNATFSPREEHQLVVFNDQLFLIGGYDFVSNTQFNDVWRSDDGIVWTELTSSATFSSRSAHQVVVFNDQLLLIGGYESISNTQLNDVWSSDDGIVWTELTSSATFSPRNEHQVVVFNDQLFLTGGLYYNGITEITYDDAWSSDNGIDWTLLSTNATSANRNSHQMVVLDDQLFLIGGTINTGTSVVLSSSDGITWTSLTENAPHSRLNFHQAVVFEERLLVSEVNEVWSSDNGIDWTLMNSNPAFSPRADHFTAVLNDQLFIIGGESNDNDIINDVWRSDDGINWTLLTTNANFPPRQRHQIVVFNDTLFVIAGESIDDELLNNVWSSTDGITWIELTSSATFSPRAAHHVTVFRDKLFLIGGETDGSISNDVWSSTNGISWTLLTQNASFSTRFASAFLAFNDQLLLIGGTEFDDTDDSQENIERNDVWSSIDGITWIELTSSATFSPRAFHDVIALDNQQLLLVGGYIDDANTNEILSDVWTSTNGITWTESTSNASFSGRALHKIISWNEQLYLLAGVSLSNDGLIIYSDEVWRSTDAINWQKGVIGRFHEAADTSNFR